MLFVVAGGTFESHCLPSEVDFERYLSWLDLLLEVIAFDFDDIPRVLLLLLEVIAPFDA